ncbi:hypothetical protein WJX84_011178 [Apatococcus fuscideae]|uniref:ABC transporter domain-containing protein n=1 Tax=Apatococcus fuscideae TaxID=2026836 RepID=A0AAW1RR49_9CHLO
MTALSRPCLQQLAPSRATQRGRASLTKPRHLRSVVLASTTQALAIEADRLSVSFKGSSGHKQVLKRASLQNPDHQLVLPTVAADVAFGLGRLRLAADDVNRRVQQALRAVSMEDFADRPVHTLSGGQKQRAAIAGVLAQDPKVLLLDELTTFLDDDDREGVIRAVKGLHLRTKQVLQQHRAMPTSRVLVPTAQ